MSNLKEKLSEKIVQSCGESNTVPAAEIVSESEGTIIPFKRGEEQPSLSVVPDMAIGFSEVKERIQLLQLFVKDFMKQGQDYGVIPGCNKPSLLKPGAEKLCDVFGFSKLCEVTNRIEDWDKGFFCYEVKVSLVNKKTGVIEAEGLGSCNSKEKKFRYQDAYSVTNTLLKMSKKRALVDAVLSATRASGLFTQDIEDMQEEIRQMPEQRKDHSIEQKISDHQDPTRIQLTDLFTLVAVKGFPASYIKKLMQSRYHVTESRELSKEQLKDLYLYLSKTNNK